MTRDQITAAVPLPEASRSLGVSVSTLRRWIGSGAPVVSQGKRGRGRCTRIDLGAVRAWRAGNSGLPDHEQADSRAALALLTVLRKQLPDTVAQALAKVDRAVINGQPAWRALGIYRHESAAGFEVLVFQEVCSSLDRLLEHEARVIALQRRDLANLLELRALSQLPPDEPPEITRLRAIFRESL